MSMIQIATGLPVVVTFQPDGTLSVEVDLSEVFDLRSSTLYVDGEEVEDFTDEEHARCEAALQRTSRTITITA